MTTQTNPVTLLDALDDPQLFAPAFHPTASWGAWRSALRALFALPPSSEDLTRYRTHTGRETWPSSPAREAWLVVGRRGGKSRIAAVVAVFLACFRDYSRVLARGERGHVMVLAADRRQARVVFRYIAGLLDGVPMLAQMIERRRTEAIDLGNRITIEVHTASFRAVRGYTVCAAILDEVAFWPTEDSANPDVEIVAALRPTMATVPEPLLLGISSPYARRGVLWDAFKAHWGQDRSPVLVWRAPTVTMNPTLDARVIAAAYDADEAAASAEYGGEFRRDIETFVSREVIDACVIPGRRELPWVPGVEYRAFVDPSGGSSDSFGLAIAHIEARDRRRIAVLDVLREIRPPFSPEAATAELALLLRAFRVVEVTGDKYAGQWPAEAFRAHGVNYRPAEKPKSDLYRDSLPSFNAGTVELLDHPRLIAQLCSLERRTARSGRDTVDHPPHAHDDLSNVTAGVIADLLVHHPGADGWTMPLLGTAYYGASFNGWSHREPPGLPPPRPPRGTRWT
jgi:hypothetical protein